MTAATPDGNPSNEVSQPLEIKNPYSVRSVRDQSLEEAVSKQKSFCLEKNKKLKQRHDYYY